jgi:formiminoglutamate deiminase
MRLIHCQHAWLPTGVHANVLITIQDGRITDLSIAPPGGVPAHAEHRAGVTLPGFANAHSHAFHRALRGRTHHDQGTFWTWRDQMYTIADRLDPDRYYQLARAVYAEMALAGITCVGEFHYLHHGPGGTRYADPNAMGNALLQAATDAGIRITLLDTLYLTSTAHGAPLEGVQQRYGDGALDRWSERVEQLKGSPTAKIGAALHSVRAVPADVLSTFADRAAGQPTHAHVSEQPAENDACLAAYGMTPVELLNAHGVLRPTFTAVHATHLTPNDITLLAGSYACFCPTTERDLGDGIGPAHALDDAGARLTLGSDSHAVLDFFEESRALELNERLASRTRGRFAAQQLLTAATSAGHASLGWHDAGILAIGARADLVTVTLDSVRTAGSDPDGVLFSAAPADITHVTADGRDIAHDGRHADIDVAAELQEAIRCLR